MHSSEALTVFRTVYNLYILCVFLQEVVQLPLEFVKQLCLKIQCERPGKVSDSVQFFVGEETGLFL